MANSNFNRRDELEDNHMHEQPRSHRTVRRAPGSWGQ